MNKLYLIAFILLIQGCSSIPKPTYPGEIVWNLRYGGDAICVARDNNVLCTSDRATDYYTPQILENRQVENTSGPACYYFISTPYKEGKGCRNYIQYHMSYPTGTFMHDVSGYRKHEMINLLEDTDRMYRTIILRDKRGNPVL